jgi:hypothetical protein
MPPRASLWAGALPSALAALAALLTACAPAVPTRLPSAPPPPTDQADAGIVVRVLDGGGEIRLETQPAPVMGGDARVQVVPDAASDETAPAGREAAAGEAAASDSDAAGAADDGDGDGDGDGDAAPAYDGPPPVQPRAGEVLIDELLVNPAGTDTNREWIEIVNTTLLAFDLHALHVADSSKEVAVDAGVLAPGAVVVLGQSADATKNGGAPVAFAYGNTISLNNDGDSITICLGACADGLILNSVSWGSDLGAAYDGHAVMVAPEGGAFCPAAEPFGSAGSFGTPGAANPPCAP